MTPWTNTVQAILRKIGSLTGRFASTDSRNRPDKSPHQNRTYAAAHPTGISETFRSLRVRGRISAPLPLRSLQFQKCPFSAKGIQTETGDGNSALA
jgi:hypothetical protein